MPVLLLIDFQEERRTKGSDYYLGAFEPKIQNAKLLLDHFHANNWPVVLTRHIELNSTSAFVEGTEKAEIISELKPADSDLILTKNKISPFYGTSLEQVLKELREIDVIVAGIMTNLCVRSAVSDLYDRDYKIKIVTDAFVSSSDEIDRFTFTDLKETRPEVELVSTKDLLS